MAPDRLPQSALPSAADLAGVGRLEAMTMRCDRTSRRRIETAWVKERSRRPDLSLGRFLAERTMDGLAGREDGFGPALLPESRLDLDELSQVVSVATAHAAGQAIGTELVPIEKRLATIEKTLGVMADVIRDVALRLAATSKS